MTRSQLRACIFELLFESDFTPTEEMDQHVTYYLAQLEASEENKEYIKDKFHKIQLEIHNIDTLINERTTGWKTTRMNKVDLAILRLAIYEIQSDVDIPTGVAINEAVELAKKFSSDEGPAFINGVLSKIIE